MLVADTFAIALTILGILLSFQGLWLLCRALWPDRTIRSADRCKSNPVLSFVIGLPITGLMMLISGAASAAGGPGQAVSLIVFTVWLFYAGIGTAGLATHIGKRLESPIDEFRPWRATLRGGIALSLAYLVPIVGWIVILFGSFVMGAGATTMSFFRTRAERDAAATPPPLDAALAARLAGGADPAALGHTAYGRQRDEEVLR